jgi:TonB family protein
MVRQCMQTLMVILLIATVTAKPASAQDQAPSTSTPTGASPVTKHGRMDVKHPLHIGSDYYPKKSLQSHEEGKCVLAFFIETDGTVPAAQLLKPTGFSRLNVACIESVIGVPMIPATINGTPVAGWSDFNLVWIINHPQPYQPAPERSAFPRVADDYEFQVGEKYYPAAARAKHERGYCLVHTTVGSTGAALNATITRSTGSTALDQACLAAVKDARFTPELQGGQPVPDSTDIAIYW